MNNVISRNSIHQPDVAGEVYRWAVALRKRQVIKTLRCRMARRIVSLAVLVNGTPKFTKQTRVKDSSSTKLSSDSTPDHITKGYWNPCGELAHTSKWLRLKTEIYRPVCTLADLVGLRVAPDIRTRSVLVQTTRRDHLDIRTMLRIRDLPIISSSKHHTHPKMAAERTSASDEIVRSVLRIGRKPYFVSMCATDQLEGYEGSRLFYWHKDYKANFRLDKIRPDHVLVMIDVDYYCDMNYYLSFGVPVILYTVVPATAAFKSDESSMRITNNTIEMAVSGGATYKHQVWDYDSEVVTAPVRKRWYEFYKHNYYFYHVEQKIINGDNGTNRRIICLTPYINVPRKYLDKEQETSIKRKIYTHNGVNMVYNAVTDALSLSINGEYHSIDTTGRMFSAILHRCQAKVKTSAIMMSDIETFMHHVGASPSQIKIEAALLHKIIVTNLDLKLEQNAITTASIDPTYTAVVTGKTSTVNVDEVCRILSTPLVEYPSVVPINNLDNDIAGVSGRVLKPANTKIPPRGYSKYLNEFAALVVSPDIAGMGSPISIDEVKDIQAKPSQRARTKLSEHELGVFAKNRLKTFGKKEAYESPNDQRIITTCDPKLTIELSRFTYAFKNNVLKRFDWYGPAKTPAETCDILQKLTTNGAILTDFSRFDGTISEWLQRGVVQRIYMRWINASDQKLFNHYFEQVFINRAISRNGYRYDAGWGTRSGSPLTTDGNTLINAFIHYASFRNMGDTPETAFKNLGIYSGDDGVTGKIDNLAAAINGACLDCGLQVKMDTREVNQPINYLGRIFPSPCTSRSSHQDMCRTLPKLHLSMNVSVNCAQAAVNKMTGYLISDYKTPILREYAQLIFSAYADVTPGTFLREEEFKIECGSWPQDDEVLIFESVAKQLNMTVVELTEACATLKACTSLEAIPVIWHNQKPEVKLTSVVDGTLEFARNVVAKKDNKNQPNNDTKTSDNQVLLMQKRANVLQPGGIGPKGSTNANKSAKTPNVGATNNTTSPRPAAKGDNSNNDGEKSAVTKTGDRSGGASIKTDSKSRRRPKVPRTNVVGDSGVRRDGTGVQSPVSSTPGVPKPKKSGVKRPGKKERKSRRARQSAPEGENQQSVGKPTPQPALDDNVTKPKIEKIPTDGKPGDVVINTEIVGKNRPRRVTVIEKVGGMSLEDYLTGVNQRFNHNTDHNIKGRNENNKNQNKNDKNQKQNSNNKNSSIKSSIKGDGKRQTTTRVQFHKPEVTSVEDSAPVLTAQEQQRIIDEQKLLKKQREQQQRVGVDEIVILDENVMVPVRSRDGGTFYIEKK